MQQMSEVIEFLSVLAQETDPRITFQTFCDQKMNGYLSQIHHGTFRKTESLLRRLNERGAGVYFVVNRTNFKGRKKDNITHIRAGFVDIDNGQAYKVLLEPSCCVSSDRGPHLYWFLKTHDPRLPLFEKLQKSLIAHYNSDQTVFDLPRVMRLPGFYHLKNPNSPKLIKIDQFSDVTYDLEDLLTQYEMPKDVFARPKDVLVKVSSDGSKFMKWAQCRPINKGVRNHNVLVLCKEGLARGVSHEHIRQTIADYCHRSGLPVEEGLSVLERQIKKHLCTPFRTIADFQEGK